MERISRRSFLKGTVAAVIAAQACERAPQQDSSRPRSYAFLTPDEAAFIEPAVERLIPADETGPGALDADVPVYIDRQLAGAWGAGGDLYRSGPWQSGKPEQGYQLRFTPAELRESGLDPEFYADHAFREPGGCDECGGTGFMGRTAVTELLDMTDRIRQMILDRRPAAEIKQAAREDGMTFLRESALEKALAGATTLREINKVTFVE